MVEEKSPFLLLVRFFLIYDFICNSIFSNNTLKLYDPLSATVQKNLSEGCPTQKYGLPGASSGIVIPYRHIKTFTSLQSSSV